MDLYRVECLISESIGWRQAINADQMYDAVVTAMKLSKFDKCNYRVRFDNKIISLFNDGKVLKDESCIYKVT